MKLPVIQATSVLEKENKTKTPHIQTWDKYTLLAHRGKVYFKDNITSRIVKIGFCCERWIPSSGIQDVCEELICSKTACFF